MKRFRDFKLDEHIRNLEQMIPNYQISITIGNINIGKKVLANVRANLTDKGQKIIKLMANIVFGK